MTKSRDWPGVSFETLIWTVDQVNSAVMACDERAVVTLFNAEAERILNVPRSQVLGRRLHELPAEARGPLTALARVLRETLEAGEQYRRQTLLLSEEYTPAMLGYTTSVIYDTEDELTGAVVVFADLSDESAQLLAGQHAEQLAQMTRLASLIAHEVKNPLATIQLFAESLAHHHDRSVQDAAHAIVEEVGHCRGRLDTIRAGLAPANGPDLPIPYSDLAQVATRVTEREALWHRTDIKLRTYPETCFVPLDAGSAESLLANLIGYLAAGTRLAGPISVRLQCSERTAVLEMEAGEVRHADLRRSPADTRTGIAASEESPAGPPPGLGLWIAKRIAVRGGGKVTAEQQPTFARLRASLPHLDGHRLQNRTLVVADDEDTLRRLMARLLTAQGSTVLEAHDGREVLTHLAAHPVDAVVTDSLMPGMDGFALLERLPVSLPVLMVSGTGDSRDRVADNWRRGMAFLSKPFSSEEFLVALAYVMWEADR